MGSELFFFKHIYLLTCINIYLSCYHAPQKHHPIRLMNCDGKACRLVWLEKEHKWEISLISLYQPPARASDSSEDYYCPHCRGENTRARRNWTCWRSHSQSLGRLPFKPPICLASEPIHWHMGGGSFPGVGCLRCLSRWVR